MAGLPARRAWVWVAPPLAPSAPNMGSVSSRSPAAENPHPWPLSRLKPVPSETAPEQFVPVLSATMLPFTVTVPARLAIPSALPAIVDHDTALVPPPTATPAPPPQG